MDFYKVIRTWRNITSFKNDTIPKKKILRILQSANLAPRFGKMHTWNFLIIKKSSMGEVKEMLCRSFNRQKAQESGNLSVRAKFLDDLTDDLKEFCRTLGEAPMAIVVYIDKEIHPWKWKNNICDASAAIDNLILAAWNEGIGSCWIKGPVKKKEAQIKEFLRIPEDKEIIGIVPIGIPAHMPKSPPTEDIRSKVKWFGL